MWSGQGLLLLVFFHFGKFGIDHVAIGSDFDGGIKPPAGLDDAAAWPKLAAALRRRGMSYDDVLKIFSLNALRVLAWRPAATVARP